MIKNQLLHSLLLPKVICQTDYKEVVNLKLRALLVTTVNLIMIKEVKLSSIEPIIDIQSPNKVHEVTLTLFERKTLSSTTIPWIIIIVSIHNR